MVKAHALPSLVNLPLERQRILEALEEMLIWDQTKSLLTMYNHSRLTRPPRPEVGQDKSILIRYVMMPGGPAVDLLKLYLTHIDWNAMAATCKAMESMRITSEEYHRSQQGYYGMIVYGSPPPGVATWRSRTDGIWRRHAYVALPLPPYGCVS